MELDGADSVSMTRSRPRSDLPAGVPRDIDSRLPQHLAIIMDGNRRWAVQQRLPRAVGHRTGARNVRPVVEACAELGIRCLTLFAFSTENWRRPPREVDQLVGLIRRVLETDLDEVRRRDVCVRIIGDRSRFPADLQRQMERAESLTARNTGMTLNVAANFGGRWDVTQAARAIAEAVAERRLVLDRINEEVFASFLSLASVPAPDLCIRTGGDHRISNFLLWDLAYTELYFTDTYWPDFDERELGRAFDAFAKRKRRFGKSEPITTSSGGDVQVESGTGRSDLETGSANSD